LLWQAAGVPVPPYLMLDDATDLAAVEVALGLPLFVKPACEGSSIGITKVLRPGELGAAYAAAAKHDSLVIAERAILGGEYTVAILGDQALPIIKIEPSGEFYDYEAKYLRDDTEYRIPSGLGDEREREMRDLALRAFAVLGGRGWGRMDLMLDAAGRMFCLEANTSPGMTDHSLVPMAAKSAGIPFPQLVVKLLAEAHCG